MTTLELNRDFHPDHSNDATVTAYDDKGAYFQVHIDFSAEHKVTLTPLREGGLSHIDQCVIAYHASAMLDSHFSGDIALTSVTLTE
jgi:hypothetical protein